MKTSPSYYDYGAILPRRVRSLAFGGGGDCWWWLAVACCLLLVALLVLVVPVACMLLVCWGAGSSSCLRPTLENLPPGRIALASFPFSTKSMEEYKLRESGFTYKISSYVHFKIYFVRTTRPRAQLVRALPPARPRIRPRPPNPNPPPRAAE